MRCVPSGFEFQIDVEWGGKLRILDENAKADARAMDEIRAEGVVPRGATGARFRSPEVRVHDEFRRIPMADENGLLGVA